MVEFLSFFLVLATGVKPIQLTVAPPVVRVEILLDEREIATLTGPHWAFLCDLGLDPEPHELIAIGRDDSGREIDRAVQWINLGVQPARARMSFQEDGTGRIRSVGLSWESVGERKPLTIAVTFDDTRLEIEDPGNIPLPSYDPATMHFVSATMRFRGGRTTRIDAGFGGEYGEEVATELSAVSVVLAPKTRMPSREKLGGWFLKDGRVLEVQAVEKGPADVLVVRDPAAQRRLERLAEAAIAKRRGPLSGTEIRRRRTSRPLPGDVKLSHDTHLRFVAPYAVPLYASDGVTSDLFARSERYSAQNTGLLWLTHQVSPRGFPFKLTEAIAIAGMSAHASNRRRALVVILDAEPNDPSRYSPAAVRRYLNRLRVPLYVWSTSPGVRSEWGEADFVGDRLDRPGSTDSLYDAVRALDRDLQRQRLVWLKGRHLPEDVELSAEAEGRLTLAGVDGDSP